MQRLVLILVIAGILAPAATAQAAVTQPRLPPRALAGSPVAPVPVAFHFRSRSRFGYGPRYGYGYGRHSFLHRVVKTAFWLYILHLFFTHGGLSILLWIIIIALVVSLLRRRRRRYSYGPQSSWR